jgi:TonB family protein
MHSFHRLHAALALTSAALTACATTRAVDLERSPSEPRARVTLAPLVADDTIRLVPQAIEPMLPTADRLARRIEALLGERATVGVSFCVSPAGRVVKAELARTSSVPFFDHAVMTDIMHWRFVAQPGPEHLRTCQAATIVYYPRT